MVALQWREATEGWRVEGVAGGGPTTAPRPYLGRSL